MNINQSIFKAYDIRGTYPDQINEEAVDQIVRAIFTFFKKDIGKDKLTVVVGRDMRISSPALHERTVTALVEMGAQVVDIGLVPTTTVYFTVMHGKYDVGIQISASHNPSNYNGIKFLKFDGQKIVKIAENNGMEDVKRIALSQSFIEPQEGGTVIEKTNAVTEEIDASFEAVQPQIKRMKIVADAANAMGAVILEEIARRIDVDLVKMNFELDGTFPAHQADPLQFALWKDLQKRVVDEKADIGIMPDGDSDRIFFVDETGEIIPATLITALITKEILQKHPQEKVVVDIRYIRNVQAVVQKYNGKMSISRVGHSLITPQVNQEKAYFAGESSGHYYFLKTGGAESSARVILHVLNALSRAHTTVSQLLKEFRTSVESGELNFKLHEGTPKEQVFESLHTEYADGQFTDLDGIALSYADWRFSVRASNTEPLLRLNVEGATDELVKDNVKRLTEKIISCGAEVE
ncbi:MAG: phosphomannomutase/phosphoglucomutase [Candidatus Roizmanbacteria bacterium]|nr:phosphomannomutase/phosphoglucomutase [Candidatus Roizmanbacteria bacterium]